jgi:1-acyl-sn-glycerol-3-phosphate acyltransferase
VSSLAWTVGRVYMGLPTRLLTRLHAYGVGRIPPAGGLVLAINHLHWIDVPIVGVTAPREVDFVAKVEAHRVPGLGRFIRLHGAIAVRRGESDRDAVRAMRESVRNGRVLGLFVEGTRQLSGHPGAAQPGAAMVALQEGAPVLPVAINGSQRWSPTHPAPCSIAYGRPLTFDGLAKNGKGYKEATAEIERRIHALFEWLVDVHARGRPRNLEPPL